MASERRSKRSRRGSILVSLYAWGDNASGQLGLGQLGQDRAPGPSRLPDASGRSVRQLSGGEKHSLLLREDGCVLACGGNEYGQLGCGACGTGPGAGELGKFAQVTPLESKRIVCIAAGAWHSLALDEDGQVFSWGRNHRGQLGREEDTGSSGGSVRLIRQIASHQATQVSAGQSHSLVLTRHHLMFAFGDNSRGQLGQGHQNDAPGCQLIASLVGLPIGRVACGGHHCLALSHSGVVFGWGANSKGQLGCGDTKDQAWPMQCKTLRGQQIRHIACGFEHSAALTADGGLFTFGCGLQGQLGHAVATDELLPKRVADLMGSSVVQVACGRAHTLVYQVSTGHGKPSASGRVYGFGASERGQLGCGAAAAPPSVTLDGKKRGGCVPVAGLPDAISELPQSLFAGGDSSFLKMAAAAAAASASTMLAADDFRCERPCWLSATVPPVRLDECLATPDSMRRLSEAAMTLASYNCAFLRTPLGACPSRADHGVDLDKAVERLDKLATEISKEAEDQLLAGLVSLLGELRNRTNYPDIECLRFFLLAPFVHLFARPALYEHLHTDYAQCLIRLEPIPLKIVSHWLSQLAVRHFRRIVGVFKSAAGHILAVPRHASRAEALAKERGLEGCMGALRLLHEVNAGRAEALACSHFYLSELNTTVDIAKDYVLWIQRRGQTDHFSFCDYPFVFDGVAKMVLLRTDARLKMQQAVQAAQARNFFTAMAMDPNAGLVSPVLVLQVRRDNIVGDAISHLSKYPPEELRKPLKVHFVGEEAQDEGGVSKEFFLLIFREILNPLYGMFRSYDSRLIWFNAGTLEDANLFHLIGILCGLAIYNSFLAAVPFPLALYKKLLKRRPNLDDLKELDPVVGKNMQELLEFETASDIEALMLTFEIDIDYYGELQKRPLGKGPSDEAVTLENRQRYVDAYVEFVFNSSCSDAYAAFHDGFHKVCGGVVLAMFEPAELQTMLIGEADNFNWDELEKNTEYIGVYFARHEVIVNFWRVFHQDLTEGQRRKFLHFLTGCDRVPIQGMGSIRIRIQPVHGGVRYLPVAHTCYNLLDLPMYPDRETLRTKLTLAIEQTEGFALV